MATVWGQQHDIEGRFKAFMLTVSLTLDYPPALVWVGICLVSASVSTSDAAVLVHVTSMPSPIIQSRAASISKADQQ